MPTAELALGPLRIKFSWQVVLCIAIGFILLVNLGMWQLRRAEEKRVINDQFEQRSLAAPTPLTSMSDQSLSADNRESLKQLKVSIQGSYLNNYTILIENQRFHRRFGYEVLTPVEQKNSQRIVLVSRGWIGLGQSPEQLPTIPEILEEQTLAAELYVPPIKTFFKTEKPSVEQWPIKLHHFDMQLLQSLFERPVFPYILRLNDGQPGVLERHWKRILLNPNTNTSYAVQWFGMAFVLLLGACLAGTNIITLLSSKKHTAEDDNPPPPG